MQESALVTTPEKKHTVAGSDQTVMRFRVAGFPVIRHEICHGCTDIVHVKFDLAKVRPMSV